jgi:hypothetical protein
MDICFSFDTTGSMYPCLTQVRRYVRDTARKLFSEIPGLRIAVITHGDYCDGSKVITQKDFSTDVDNVCRFIENAPATSGGDADECYEYVLSEAQKLSWSPDGQHAFVMMGDAEPHDVGYRYGSVVNKLDWRKEVDKLAKQAKIYSVQCLGRAGSRSFWEALAERNNGYYLTLDQFSEINDMLQAIVYRQADKLWEFENFLDKQGKVSPSVSRALDTLKGKKPSKKKVVASAFAVHPSRFQVIPVDSDTAIKPFVEENGLLFKKGRGFYEFTKPVVVQKYKEVIIRNRKTGEMFSGDHARKLLGMPIGVDAKVRPSYLTEFQGFVQSTSVNRKLLAGTAFLYEVEDFHK